MKSFRLPAARTFTAIKFFAVSFLPLASPTREEELQSAQVIVRTGQEDCAVELDATPARKTNRQGTLLLPGVEPTDHYLHVQCPEQREIATFISPRPGQKLEVRFDVREAQAAASTRSPLEAAEVKIHLRQLIQDAVRLRARGHFEEAVQHLRDATQLDPENSDLHRELGITFLLNKDWKRARVEMLEAIRHKPDDADAHNGLGYALEKLGQLDAALKEYRTATHLEPDDPSYRQHYVEALGKVAAHRAEKKK